MIPSKILGGTYIKEGADSLGLSDDNLDDRIINLKFIRNSGRSFILRSDYEPVFHNDGINGSVSFKACVEKPDIKITYRQVANSVAIEVDIEIVNFNIGDGEHESIQSMDSIAGDPVAWCIVQMGYRAQFPDWTKPERSGNIAQYYDLNNNAISTDQEVRRGRQILVQILTGFPESYPPDRKLVYKGIIGTMENGLRWDHTEADLVKGYGDADFPKDFSEIEEVLFQFVTRRFIKASVQHIAQTARDFTNMQDIKGALNDIIEKDYEQEVLIYDSISGEWKGLPLTDRGIMAIDDANRFGVICAVSETLRSMRANALYGYGLTAEEAALLRPIPPTSFDSLQDTLGGQLAAIQQHYPFLRWYALSDGSFYFYHERDTDSDLWTDPFVKELQKEPVLLPAIYDMTPAGTRVIRCPYISFISPMTTVLFQSRYSIGTLTGYFYPVQTNAFLVITAKIEFATVQDINVMELMCVDLPPKEIEIDSTGEIKIIEYGEPKKTPEVVKLQEQRNMQWIERELTVVLHRAGALDTESRWENIVRNDIVVAHERWPEDGLPTEKDMLLALKEWNPDYFDPGKEYMGRFDSEHGESIENLPSGIGGRTGIKVPWLLVGDKINVRYPFQPEYPDNEKVVV